MEKRSEPRKNGVCKSSNTLIPPRTDDTGEEKVPTLLAVKINQYVHIPNACAN